MLNFDVKDNMLRQTELSKWCDAFLHAKTEPMERELAEVFFVLAGAEARNQSIPDGSSNKMYQLIDGRAKYLRLSLTEHATALLACLSPNPAVAVMYLSAIRWHQAQSATFTVNIEYIARLFPVGFPTTDELSRLWDEQKVKATGGDNLLDFVNPEIDFLLFHGE